jgi:hypothetical protein
MGGNSARLAEFPPFYFSEGRAGGDAFDVFSAAIRLTH